MTNFGEKIRLLRLKKGLSQENMADMLSISTTAYGDIERNKTELTVVKLQKIATILRVEINEIINIQSEVHTLEFLKLKAEKERFEIETIYWREKFEALQATKTKEFQSERPQIGFMKAS